jgi:hypothetical protein
MSPFELIIVIALLAILVRSKNLFTTARIKSATAVLSWAIPAVLMVAAIGGAALYMKRSSRMSPYASANPGPEVRDAVPAAAPAPARAATADRSALDSGTPTAPTTVAFWKPVLTDNESQASEQRLTFRSTSRTLPEWAIKDDANAPVEIRRASDRTMIPVSSGRFATRLEAEQDVTRRVQTLLIQTLREIDPDISGGPMTVSMINAYVVQELVLEEFDKDFGSATGTMYRAHALLDVTPEFRKQVRERRDALLVDNRLVLLGTLTGLATLMLGTAALYFRLDDATHGGYRRRLKLASASLVAAGSLVAFTIIRSV